MSSDIHEMYMRNAIFRSCVDRGRQHNFSYGRTLEMALKYFASLQESYDEAELERIMKDPPKSLYLTDDEMMILSQPTYAEIKYPSIKQ